MSASVPGAEGVRVRVTRDLGLFDVTMAAIGAMVGAAIFLLVGPTFRVAGPLTFVSTASAAAAALLAGLAYAELGSRRAGESGGAYAWVSAVLPTPSGFLTGWLSWGAHIAASALGALGLGVFFVELVRPTAAILGPVPLEARYVAVGVLLVSAGLHFARIHTSARTLGRVTLVRVLFIAGVVGIGVASFVLRGGTQGTGPVARSPSLLSLAVGAGIFFIAFQGFETIAQLSDHLKQPERNVPRGILLAVGGCLVLYVVFFVAILGNAPTGSLSGWPDCAACGPNSVDLVFASVSNFVLGEPWALEVFLIVGIVSMFGALNANLTSGIKTSVNMARDGLLPRVLAQVRGREVPPAAVAATTGVAAILLVLSLEIIAILVALAFLLLFAFVHAALIVQRSREGRMPMGFHMPLVPALPVLAIALNLAIGFSLWQYPGGLGLAATILGTLWVAAGLIFHWFAGGRERLHRAPSPVRSDVASVLTTTEDVVELERYRVFLPLRTFEDVDLVGFGARVAQARHGELSLLHVVEIPRNLPPKAIRFRYVDNRIRGLQKLAQIGERLGVDTRAVVKIGYKTYEIILDTAKEEAVNLLVLGWRGGRLEGERRILGSNIDYLIENAPYDLVVYKTKGLLHPLKRIVVLMSPIWALEGIDDLALIAAEEDRPVIEILSLARDLAEAEQLKGGVAEFLQRCHTMGLEVEHKILYATAWESVALQESAGASLLMLRATSPGGLRKFALSPVEDRIVKLARCPVLILRPGAS